MIQLQEATIKQHCKALRMPTIGSQFSTLAEQAVREKTTHTAYLEALLTVEVEEREKNTIERRIKDARLPRVKTLEEFDFNQSPHVTAAKMRDLANGGYIDRAEPVLLIGDCGTGKTHLLTGLCVAACRQKRRVRFTTAAALVNATSAPLLCSPSPLDGTNPDLGSPGCGPVADEFGSHQEWAPFVSLVASLSVRTGAASQL